MSARPKFRAHVFYYSDDNWAGPTWTWCREIKGELRDEAWDLPACESWADAWTQAQVWLRQRHTS